MDERELERLLQYRRQLDAIAAEPGPAARVLASPSAAGGRSSAIAVLPGAFNPPTRAHLALAHAASGAGFDAVYLSLGCVTLDKDDSGLLLEDRLWLLCTLAAREPHLGVLVHNRGLYAEIAEAVRRSFPTVERLAFVIGMDKIPQLFDRRYYEDMDGSLASLFERARILVAPRGAHDREALDRILSATAARRFAARFEWLPLSAEWRDVSATAVRSSAVATIPARHLPVPVVQFMRRTGAFRDERRYRLRRERLSRLRG